MDERIGLFGELCEYNSFSVYLQLRYFGCFQSNGLIFFYIEIQLNSSQFLKEIIHIFRDRKQIFVSALRFKRSPCREDIRFSYPQLILHQSCISGVFCISGCSVAPQFQRHSCIDARNDRKRRQILQKYQYYPVN